VACPFAEGVASFSLGLFAQRTTPRSVVSAGASTLKALRLAGLGTRPGRPEASAPRLVEAERGRIRPRRCSARGSVVRLAGWVTVGVTPGKMLRVQAWRGG
jgi:hypothetical protein